MLTYLVLRWLLEAATAIHRASKMCDPWIHFILVLWTAAELLLKAQGIHL